MNAPSGLLVAVIVWLLGIEVAAEAWYRFREGERSHSILWSIRWPEESNGFRFESVPEEARSILRYTDGDSAVIEWPGGLKWQLFFFRWEPGKASAQLATMHRPEICLPAAGFKFVSKIADTEIEAGGAAFSFDGSIFEADGSQMYIFRCLWEDQPALGLSQSRRFDLSVMGRLKSSWYGRRNLGQKLLQVGIVGAKSEEEARAELRTRLPALVEVK
jgi:hypothetical protein